MEFYIHTKCVCACLFVCVTERQIARYVLRDSEADRDREEERETGGQTE